MPLDPDECHENAKRCLATALETSDLILKASLTDNAQRWLRLAVDVQATKSFSKSGATNAAARRVRSVVQPSPEL